MNKRIWSVAVFLRRSAWMGRLLLVACVGLLCESNALADDEGRGCERKIKATVVPLLGTGIAGQARLCISGQGVSGNMEVEHLRPGDAYTVWFIYFDDPSKCVGGGPGVCGDADFGGVKPLGVFGRYDSAVGPADGEEEFQGRVPGLRLSPGSQVWLLIFGHGQADRADGSHLARQLLTPEDPGAGAPHLGNVVDGPRGKPAAIAVFNIR
jgi:hypothetical protein